MSAGLMSVDVSLDGHAKFGQLLQLADQDDSSDVLGALRPEQRKKHWLALAASADAFAQAHTDGRLQLLQYRAALHLHGVCAALERFGPWLAELQRMRLDDVVIESESQTDAVFRLICYFFSDAHLADLRYAQLHPEVDADTVSIFKLSQSAPNARPDAAVQRLRNELSAWAPGRTHLVPSLRTAQAFIGELESWARAHNRLGFEIRTEPVKKWFARVEEIVLHHGAPPISASPSELAVAPTALMTTDSSVAPTALMTTGSSQQRGVGLQSRSLPEAVPPSHTDVPPSRLALGVKNVSFDDLQRDDVLFLLQGICRWYEAREPSSPVPYFLRRAVRTMNVDFLTILRDLLPESTPHFEKLAGLDAKK